MPPELLVKALKLTLCVYGQSRIFLEVSPHVQPQRFIAPGLRCFLKQNIPLYVHDHCGTQSSVLYDVEVAKGQGTCFSRFYIKLEERPRRKRINRHRGRTQ